ncbi:endonuclease III [Candidatus Nitrosacidococcus tergens]|uniref:Endonuclease III n=1 Tax=Candidatus Nitrosacidococcus tergens TaxID=553981 RepID=A0A7G1Q982_9GAMM|nr:endonuclease III [Candidatus Nitrosacidococcus tergens]CAB1275763.1 endonuclease III DNA glycosylase/apyrimidinic (AP) lyase [Candidatus Nitrosacidococcus tergens]
MKTLEEIHQLFSRFQATNPEPTTELNYQTPFELLVAVILSAQATDKGVNKATALLFPVANTPQALLNLGEKGLKEYTKTINLYNNKTRNILKTCQILLDQYQGSIPNNRKELEALPGVGRKTANVILNTVFKEPIIAVDTHIFRVSNRLGLAPGKTPREVEDTLVQVIPDEFKYHAHHWLLLHGRYICTARNPHCQECIVKDLCDDYKDKYFK